jgi:hypothetical protein
LLIENDPALRQTISEYLNTDGVSTETAAMFFLQRTVDNKVELRIIEQSQSMENRFKVSNCSLKRVQKGETVLEKKTRPTNLFSINRTARPIALCGSIRVN